MSEFNAAYQSNPAAAAQRRRQLAAAQFRVLDPERRRQVEKACAEIRDQTADRGKRRASERELADYIERQVVPITRDRKIRELPLKLRDCRESGVYGVQADGRPIVVWDSKCGELRLCPDESRADQQRLADRYLPQLLDAVALGHQIHFAVLTLPNFARGNLKRGLKSIYTRFKALRRAKRNRRLLFPQIKGALAVVEAPLGTRADWHVHLNVVLITDSWLDYAELREAWGYNLEIRRVRAGDVPTDKREDALRAALLEVIKYPVVLTGEKSDKNRGGAWTSPELDLFDGPAIYCDASGKPKAPPMVEWPPALWLEWYQAHRGLRRVRAYGVLHGAKLEDRAAMDLDAVTWCGQIRYTAAGYIVSMPSLLGSIPGDKSPTRRALMDDNAHRQQAPPGDFAWDWAEAEYAHLIATDRNDQAA